MRKFPGVYMRGGTSKGIMFHRADLPEDRMQWDRVFLQVMGSPDPMQIDGLGGTFSSNNKVVIVWRSKESGVDVEYLVGQVVVGKNRVDYESNCGNMTSAVGPFAVDEGLVQVIEPITTVRALNRNTDKLIDIDVPIKNGTFDLSGDYSIAGVDGTDAKLRVNFLAPAGAKTGRLLPTGNVAEYLYIPGIGQIEVTILDVANPMVLVRAEALGLSGRELPNELNANRSALNLLELIRGTACCRMGFARNTEEAFINSPGVPKIGYYSSPQSYNDVCHIPIPASDMDICVRVISFYQLHKACPLTSANAIAVAAFLPGSIVWRDIASSLMEKKYIRLGHPSGCMTLYPQLMQTEEAVIVQSIATILTARRIMDGIVYVRD